eukprot:2193274-Rhodomonas_salina.3
MHTGLTGGRVHGDSCAEQRGGSVQRGVLRDLDGKPLIHNHLIAVSSDRRLADLTATSILGHASIGASVAARTVLLLVFLAVLALQAGVDHAANANVVAYLEVRHLAARCCDHANQLVTWHHRVLREAQVVFNEVHVGVADAAVLDVEGDILIARRIARHVHVLERVQGSLLCSKCVDLHCLRVWGGCGSKLVGGLLFEGCRCNEGCVPGVPERSEGPVTDLNALRYPGTQVPGATPGTGQHRRGADPTGIAGLKERELCPGKRICTRKTWDMFTQSCSRSPPTKKHIHVYPQLVPGVTLWGARDGHPDPGTGNPGTPGTRVPGVALDSTCQ